MKTLIILSSSSFPLSAVAGCILTGRLPHRYQAGIIRELFTPAGKSRFPEGQLHLLGSAPDGTRVAALSARSVRVILKNLASSFLEIHKLDPDSYRIVEINMPSGPVFFLGEILAVLPLAGRAGRRLVERHLEKIYPGLVNCVKLDCNCQMSDN